MQQRQFAAKSQNGFRQGFRTNNNAFVLRCAIDRARASGLSLYGVFADLSNAFPFTEQSTLWLKLRQMEAGGKIFDWLHMQYERMNYTVCHNSEMSDSFKSGIRILIGDVGLPVLWNLFLADFALHPDTDDVVLAESVITSLEQANEISKTPQGLQRKMNALGK